MIGKHEIIVRDARLQYKFTIQRNITILSGESAAGKTTLIKMIAAYENNGNQSGVEVISDVPLAVVTRREWPRILPTIHNSIVFIDEGAEFVKHVDFAEYANHSDNYFVIATREALGQLSYSTNEIYGIKNQTANYYQRTKRLYSTFFSLHNTSIHTVEKPDLVIVEDSNSGFPK